MSDIDKRFKEAMRKTKIIREVKQTLYTFSSTDLNYYLITEPIERVLVELREGRVTVERPLIVSPYEFADGYFEGFDEEQAKYMRSMFHKFGLRALRYKFKNETSGIKLLSGSPEGVAKNLNRELDRKSDDSSTIIRGIPDMWSVSLMKCVVELVSKSFRDNVRELEERGWFEDR